MELAELAARHPQASLVCGHTGGDWEPAFAPFVHTRIFMQIWRRDPTAGFTEMAVRELGARRVLYGSDAGGRSFASQLAKVHGADIPAAAKRLIFAENLKGLLGPICNQKGIRL